MKNMIKLALTLSAYAVVACLCLALVNNVTAPIIKAAADNELQNSLKVLFPDASDFEEVTERIKSSSSSIVFERSYIAKSGSTPLGAIIQAKGPTYKTSTILVAVDMNRSIKAVQFSENTDTPGIGTKTALSPYIDQYLGKSIDDDYKIGSDLDSISGATISAKGVATIINLASYSAGDFLAQNYGAESGSGEAPVVVELSPMDEMQALQDMFAEAEFEELPAGTVSNSVERSVVFTKSWLVKKSGEVVAVVMQTKGQTYKASTIMTAVALDGTLAGVRINATRDSANYGLAMLDPEFYEPFTGKSVNDRYLVKPTVPDGDIDSISGATVTTQGLANMLKVAAYEGSRYLAAQYGGAQVAEADDSFELNIIPEQE